MEDDQQDRSGAVMVADEWQDLVSRLRQMEAEGKRAVDILVKTNRQALGLLEKSFGKQNIQGLALETAEARVQDGFLDIFAEAPVGMYKSTMDGRLLAANLALARMFGYDSTEELILEIKDLGRQVFYNPQNYGIMLGLLYQNDQVEDFEAKARTKDGSSIWILLSAKVIRKADQTIKNVLGVVKDITPLKKHEMLVNREEGNYKQLFNNAFEGLFQCTPTGGFIGCNNSLAKLFGYESVNEMRHTIKEAGGQLFKDPDDYHEFARRLLKEGKVEKFEVRAQTKKNDIIWIQVNAHLVLDQDDQPSIFQGSIHDITKSKQIEARLLFESYHDPLTGLVNRTMFLDLLDKAIARSKRWNSFSFALVSLSVDRFRMIKDSLGQKAADELIAILAKVLVDCLRTEDICARLSGEEFSLILSDVARVADSIRVIERINEALKKPFTVQGTEVFITFNAGIVMSGLNYLGGEDMLSDADAAMYRAQTDPDRSFAIFNDTMQKEAIERLRMETDLRNALDRQEFCLYYQPIISLITGEIEAFEALLRWERPGVGLLTPYFFIPVMEETGMIVPAGEWVIKQACVQTKVWREKFPRHKNLTVNVNVSAKQLARPELTLLVRQALSDSGLSPECLKLEVTESVVMEKPETAVKILNDLKDLGVKISIDDFGTGHSSLAYLNILPADILKIDKSFIFAMKENQKGSEIVKAILVLAHTLNKQVVAEGVETSRQLSQLIKLKCEFVQGYYFSKPVNVKDAEILLEKGFKRNPAD